MNFSTCSQQNIDFGGEFSDKVYHLLQSRNQVMYFVCRLVLVGIEGVISRKTLAKTENKQNSSVKYFYLVTLIVKVHVFEGEMIIERVVFTILKDSFYQ